MEPGTFCLGRRGSNPELLLLQGAFANSKTKLGWGGQAGKQLINLKRAVTGRPEQGWPRRVGSSCGVGRRKYCRCRNALCKQPLPRAVGAILGGQRQCTQCLPDIPRCPVATPLAAPGKARAPPPPQCFFTVLVRMRQAPVFQAVCLKGILP